MKTKLFALFLLALLSTLDPELSTFAQSTAFTYQGRLNDGTNPANGTYNLRFALFDALTVGNQVGSPLTNSPVNVSNGLFAVTLDFGANFPGADRWLEIGVRTNGNGTFFTLSPRQKITPAPYAIYAAGVSAAGISGPVPAANLTGTYGSAVTFNNPANIFSGDGTGLSGVNALSLGGLGAASFWNLGGNTGTTPGAQFLGTTDNQPLELKVNGVRALQLIPSTNAASLIGGSAANSVTPGVVGAVIAGGGGSSIVSGAAFTNRVTDAHGVVGGGLGNVAGNDNADLADARYATVAGGLLNSAAGFSAMVGGGEQNSCSGAVATLGGGQQNTNSGLAATIGGGFLNLATNEIATVGGGQQNTSSGLATTVSGGFFNLANNQYATVGGGQQNIGSGDSATVGGGRQNTSSGLFATVGGGAFNSASNYLSTVGGGYLNLATNNYATIPGGAGNIAGGQFSFAAGHDAKALHDGAFVWSDSPGGGFSSTGNDQFLIRAGGGVGIGTATPLAQLAVNGNTRIDDQGGAYSEGLVLNCPPDMGGYGGLIFHNATRGGALDSTTVRWGVSYNYSPEVGVGTGGLSFIQSNINTRLYLASNGNVGIGTTSPSQKLHIIGNILASGTITGSSDRNVKEHFSSVNPRDVLEKVSALPITEWNYITDGETLRHIGPMAQDFYSAFNVGFDDKHISMVDADGVALAAIQGLNQKLEETRAENAGLKQRLEVLEKIIGKQK